MRAIIPVAGVGSRLRPHTYSLPKVLLNVGGKPILGHILEELQNQGIVDCTIVVGYKKELVKDYVLSNFSLNVTFVEQEERKGLGHSIWVAKDSVDMSEDVMIILGDTVFDVDLRALTGHSTNVIGVHHVEDPRRFGVVITDETGLIRGMVEKPEQMISHSAIVGLYYIRDTAALFEKLDYLIDNGITTRGEFQLTDALQAMLEGGSVFSTHEVDGWFDCGKPETLLSTNQFLLSRSHRDGTVDGAIVIPPVYIGKSAKIKNAVIGPFVTVAEGATVTDSVVKNSIISNDAVVQDSLLDSSIIGNNARVTGRYLRVNVGDSSEIDFS